MERKKFLVFMPPFSSHYMKMKGVSKTTTELRLLMQRYGTSLLLPLPLWESLSSRRIVWFPHPRFIRDQPIELQRVKSRSLPSENRDINGDNRNLKQIHQKRQVERKRELEREREREKSHITEIPYLIFLLYWINNI